MARATCLSGCGQIATGDPDDVTREAERHVETGHGVVTYGIGEGK